MYFVGVGFMEPLNVNSVGSVGFYIPLKVALKSVPVCSRVYSIHTDQSWGVLLLRIPQKTYLFKRSNVCLFFTYLVRL